MDQVSKNGSHPDPEVKPRPKRRRFTAKYKLAILDEVERATRSGEVGAILRREGLYSSNLTAWKRQRAAGELDALQPKQRGRRSTQTAETRELARVKRENVRLREKLRQADLIIAAQKKLAEVLDSLSETSES